ncbi:serine threonine-protein kinase [Musa troglodytarum]|uniref:[RNA-polymerase]-subunit kinase n=2 Tax=Musa troglodytarum TaxID=320322 RepID=A0A9E7KWF2_9LILI|nr:serine threonine-protein kinase [Musa troglodytarum]
MGCIFGKFTAGVSLFPIAAPRVTAASRSRPPAASAAGHRHPLRAPPPPPEPEPPRRPFFHHSFAMLEKIGSGTYSNVYKARDVVDERLVALKKVRAEDVAAVDSVRFMVREIALLRHLHHPNVVGLEGLAVSRVPTSPSLYLVFDYMEHDLAGLAALPGVRFTVPQVKCYMKQLLSGLEHCHSQSVLHRDIKCSNLLLNKEGILKIADFGLATFFDPNGTKPMTSKVVTLWYRPPELLLGATQYSVGVDLWSAGCILAELLTGKPILPGHTEVEQLHRIFKLCGSPSEEYFEKLKLQKTTSFGSYKCSISETFSDLPPSSVSLIEKLLALDPLERGSATSALNSEFFNTEPSACHPSELPQYPPTKEIDRKLREAKDRRQQRSNAKENGEATSRIRLRNQSYRGPAAPSTSSKVQAELDRRRLMTSASVARAERFPPPHLDAAIGFSLDSSHAGREFTTVDELFMSSDAATREDGGRRDRNTVRAAGVIGAIRPYLVGNLTNLGRNGRAEQSRRESAVALRRTDVVV